MAQPDLEPPGPPEWLTNCPRWIVEAEALTPELRNVDVRPARVITVTPDPAGFQGWTVGDEKEPEPSAIRDRILNRGATFTLDFGEHVVGYLRLRIESTRVYNDSPVRLRLVFGEVPAEIAEPFDPYSGSLSRAWLQDVQVDVDVLPAEVRLPRRYAFRYLRVEVIDASPSYSVRIRDIVCEAVSSAGVDLGQAPSNPDDAVLDRVGLRTLANCMQTVFEDGPKRDRRLWIGDLRLQALANYVSFQQNGLVKRCLLLHAGLARSEDGVIPACVFEKPQPTVGNAYILDYTALFGPTLLDYVRATNDTAFTADLWSVALHQTDFCLRFIDSETHLFRDPGVWWLFIDWQSGLHKEACLHAVLIYAARQTAELGRLLGYTDEAARLEIVAVRMALAARTHLRNPEKGLYVSGPDRQVSWATQAWMILAGVPETNAEAAVLFDALDAAPDAVRPAGPYLWHHVVEALFVSGQDARALSILRRYWGGMLDCGATTFWEVFDPEDETLSPYGSHLINSYCHAWSCTPTYFLRTYREAAG